MPVFSVPYYKGIMEIELPEKNLKGVLISKAADYKTNLREKEIVERALDNPIGSKSLEELVKDKKNMVIITSDHTRPVPSKITIPILLTRIRRVNPNIDIKILIAAGLHRPTTKEEMVEKFGETLVKNENIICHKAKDKDNLLKIGILPSGGELWINKLAVETELLISEGFIEPHFFAGFSGGRKSILPGISGAETIMANHCSEFINSENSRTGKLFNNPIHGDMLYAAKASKLAFILNVALDKDKKIISAFAGDSEFAHNKGCEFVSKFYGVSGTKSDIVVTTNGGYPLDQNVYQAVKGMTAGESLCRDGGVIIMIASCCDGHGGESFYRNVADAKNPKELLSKILKVSKKDTVPDQWEFQILARILNKHKVIIVTDMCYPKIIEDMHMYHARDFKRALELAFEIVGKDAEITLIPDGVSSIVEAIHNEG
ncbi:nickel-dependent lactate racemase [Clostridium guangxiense]|uniref:nickel-dependent lactate racemase n=1 Tax=Clostridium guangxiense TaxID=1662055 RepID=UPI001E378FF1|nr:nickel-dependent lactate racemase [Clostridium guangxiense]MCD2346193.1 nickel-dependent lactate racemase [Clostridium guangxiense]